MIFSFFYKKDFHCLQWFQVEFGRHIIQKLNLEQLQNFHCVIYSLKIVCTERELSAFTCDPCILPEKLYLTHFIYNAFTNIKQQCSIALFVININSIRIKNDWNFRFFSSSKLKYTAPWSILAASQLADTIRHNLEGNANLEPLLGRSLHSLPF